MVVEVMGGVQTWLGSERPKLLTRSVEERGSILEMEKARLLGPAELCWPFEDSQSGDYRPGG